MSASPDDHGLVARLERLAAPAGGADWRDVERRARRSRARTGALVAAVLAALAVAIPASGLDNRLVSWLDVSSGPDVVPPATKAGPVEYVYGNGLFRGRDRIATLHTRLLASLLGNTQVPLALSSPSGRWVVYHAWEGHRSGTPMLRLLDRRTGKDTVLAHGAQTFAWQGRNGLAWMQAAKPMFRFNQPRGLPGGYYGQIVVQRSPGDVPVRWTVGPPGPYLALAWAGDRLLVEARGVYFEVPEPALDPGIYAFDGPGMSRRLPVWSVVALSPDGRLVVGTTKPGDQGPSGLALVRVSDGRILARLSVSELRRAAPNQEEAGVGKSGTWSGDRIVAPFGSNKLAILRVGPAELRIDHVLVVDLAIRPRGLRRPSLSTPVFISRNVVAVRGDMWSLDDQRVLSAFVSCRIDAATCMGGSPLRSPRRWAAILQNPSRPR